MGVSQAQHAIVLDTGTFSIHQASQVTPTQELPIGSFIAGHEGLEDRGLL